MPVGRQQLHRLQPECADQDEEGNQDQRLGYARPNENPTSANAAKCSKWGVASTGRSSIGDSVAYPMKARASQPTMLDNL